MIGIKRLNDALRQSKSFQEKPNTNSWLTVFEEFVYEINKEEQRKLKQVSRVFNERLKQIVSGENTDYSPMNLGSPNALHKNCGISDIPIEISVKRLVDKKLQSNHPFSLVSVFDLPDFLANPIAIFNSKGGDDDRKVVLTEMVSYGKNFVVIIEIGRVGINKTTNSVRSVYPKEFIGILRWIAVENLLVLADKEKILDWLGKQQSNSADVTQLIEDCTNVIKGTFSSAKAA